MDDSSNTDAVRKLARLQVFLDCANGLLEKKMGKTMNTLHLSRFGFTEKDLIDPATRLLNMRLTKTSDYESLAKALRETEIYQLASFLLTEGSTGKKLSALSKSYGISASYFRRLYTKALGNSPKADLRQWRMAQSLLDLIANQSSITSIAMKYGYASPSHFSTDIKQLLGKSPYHLLKNYSIC